MINWLLKKIVGSKNQREIKAMLPVVKRINEIEVQLQSLSEDELRAKTISPPLKTPTTSSNTSTRSFPRRSRWSRTAPAVSAAAR